MFAFQMLKLVLDHCSDFLHWNHVEAIWDCLAASNGNFSGKGINARLLSQMCISCILRNARDVCCGWKRKKGI